MSDLDECAAWIRPGARAIKSGGDYRFEGEIVSVFRKRSGGWRAVVENDDGILHIFNVKQLAQAVDECPVANR